MKKNNKGFTLVELLATIAVLAVVLLGCSILYTNIHKNILQKQYENVKSLIENGGVKFANDYGNTSFFVEDLIKYGYIEPDDHDNIYDPRDKTSLNCNVVNVSSDKNNNLIAVMSEKPSKKDGKCFNNTKTNSDVVLTAKLTETNIVYPSDKTYTKQGDAYPSVIRVVKNVWTNSQLDVFAEFKNKDVDLNGAKIIWNDRQDAAKEFVIGGENKTTTTFPAESVYNGTFKADIWTKDMVKYTGKLDVHFDVEPPYIDESRVKLLNPDEENKWTQGKTVVLTVTDKDGVGLSKIYIGSKPCSELKINATLGQNAVPGMVQTFRVTEETGAEGRDFNVCAIDKLGNVSSQNTIRLSKIDPYPPDITVKTYAIIENGNINTYNAVTPISTAINKDTILGDNVWSKDGYAHILSATDNLSGVRIGKWSWNDSGEKNLYTSLSKTIIGSGDLPNNEAKLTTLTGGGKRYATVEYIDEAGNSRTVTVQVNVDRLAPTFDKLSISNQNWTKEDVIATVNHSDLGSGINTNSLKAVCGSNNVGLSASNKTTAGFTDTWSSERNNTCHYEICDNVGNCSNSNDFNIKIDKTLPNITVKYYDYIDENMSSYSGKTVLGTYSNSDVTISPWTGKGHGFIITAEDGLSNIKNGTWSWNGSGDSSFYTTLSTKLIETNYINTTQFVSLTGGGKRYGEIVFTDNAGNKRTVKLQINVDKSAPSKPNMHFVYGDWSVYGGGWTNKDLYAGWTSSSPSPNGSTDVGSGIDHYEISSDGTNFTIFNYNKDNDMYHMSSSGKHTRYFRAVDKVGNKSEKIAITGYFDNTAPTFNISAFTYDGKKSKANDFIGITPLTTTAGNFSYTNTENDANSIWNNVGYDFVFDPKDDHSGVASLVAKYNTSGSFTLNKTLSNSENITSTSYFNLTGQGRRYAEITLTDKAGNTTTKTIQVNIDRNKPTFNISAFTHRDGTSKANDFIGVTPLTTTSGNFSYTNTENDANSIWNNVGYDFVFDPKDNESGIASFVAKYNTSGSYSLSKSIPNSENIIGTSYFNLTGEGRRYAEITLKDKAGNETTKTIQVNIDKTSPGIDKLTTGSRTCSDGKYQMSTSFEYSDNYKGSGISKVIARCSDTSDDIGVSNADQSSASDVWKTPRNATCYYRVYDKAGNHGDSDRFTVNVGGSCGSGSGGGSSGGGGSTCSNAKAGYLRLYDTQIPEGQTCESMCKLKGYDGGKEDSADNPTVRSYSFYGCYYDTSQTYSSRLTNCQYIGYYGESNNNVICSIGSTYYFCNDYSSKTQSCSVNSAFKCTSPKSFYDVYGYSLGYSSGCACCNY